MLIIYLYSSRTSKRKNRTLIGSLCCPPVRPSVCQDTLSRQRVEVSNSNLKMYRQVSGRYTFCTKILIIHLKCKTFFLELNPYKRKSTSYIDIDNYYSI